MENDKVHVIVNNVSDERLPHIRLLTGDNTNIAFDKLMRQFCVVNNSSVAVYIDIGEPSVTRFKFVIPSRTIFVSPCFDFNNLQYTLSGSAYTLTPELYAYTREFMTPMITQIPVVS